MNFSKFSCHYLPPSDSSTGVSMIDNTPNLTWTLMTTPRSSHLSRKCFSSQPSPHSLLENISVWRKTCLYWQPSQKKNVNCAKILNCYWGEATTRLCDKGYFFFQCLNNFPQLSLPSSLYPGSTCYISFPWCLSLYAADVSFAVCLHTYFSTVKNLTQ